MTLSKRVADDGSGMEDIDDAVRFGKGTRAGRRCAVLAPYGIGMTDALCKLGPRADVMTLRDAGASCRRRRVQVGLRRRQRAADSVVARP